MEETVPAEILTSALYTRFRSRQEHTFAEKVLSAMREKFGGHLEPKTKKSAKNDDERQNQNRRCSKFII